MMKSMGDQKVLWASEGYPELDAWLEENKIRRIFLVGGGSLSYLRINDHLKKLETCGRASFTRFSDFTPNPEYGSVVEGVNRFRAADCEAIIAVGGGSAMDVAKCIKLYAKMNPHQDYLKQEIKENDIPLMAVPTTAGSGSEATRFAVVYHQNEKLSISNESIIPGTVLMDPGVLLTLPAYQKRSTMLDAVCHAVEAYWSVKSTPVSHRLSACAIEKILENKDGYLANDEEANAAMLEAAYIAGQAINIAQTTAGHAMCYKLTSTYRIAHGHAAALCVSQLWPYMLSHMKDCIDSRGKAYLKEMFRKLGGIMGGNTAEYGAEKFNIFLASLDMPRFKVKESDIAMLTSSVNLVRLKNNPVRLDNKAIESMYRILL